MASTINSINSTLSTIDARIPTAELSRAGQTVQNQWQAGFTTELGKTVGEVIGGFQALTQVVDQVVSGQVFGNAIVRLTSDIPGIDLSGIIPTSTITGAHGEVISQGTALNRLAGSTVVPTGSRYRYYGASNTNALNAMLTLASAKPLTQVLGVVALTQSGQLKNFVETAATQALSAVITPVILNFQQRVNTTINNALNGFIQNVVDSIDGPLEDVIVGLANGKLKADSLSSAMDALKRGDYNTAVRLVDSVSTNPISQIEDIIYGLNLGVFSRLTAADAQEYGRLSGTTLSIPNYSVGSNTTGWKFENTNTTPTNTTEAQYEFEAIQGLNELESEFNSSNRDITEIVFHWSETFADQDIGAKWLHDEAVAAGNRGIPYHFVIRKDGTIERGAPINTKVEHIVGNPSHNELAISVCFVAGFTAMSGESGYQATLSDASISSAQMKTFDDMISVFLKVFPGGQIFGHNSIETNREDPGFDVPAYVRACFGHNNATPGTAPALTPPQITNSEPIDPEIEDPINADEDTFVRKEGVILDPANSNASNVKPSAKTNIQRTLSVFSKMQEIYGDKLTITDAIPASNGRRSSQSQHFYGRALDIRITDKTNAQKEQMLKAAISAGFTGFGLGSTIMHIDLGPRRYWGYTSSGNATSIRTGHAGAKPFAGKPLSHWANKYNLGG